MKHPPDQGFLPRHGGYKNLLSYRKAQIVYDGTVYFCDHYIERYSRTRDQMIQAARSGKQNIIEGSQASAVSTKSELKLTSVARASLEELLEDYRDFLRTHKAAEWDLENPATVRLRALNRKPKADYQTFQKGIEHRDPTVCANVLIGLIKVTNYLLDRQLAALQRSFMEKGGLTERMTTARNQWKRGERTQGT